MSKVNDFDIDNVITRDLLLEKKIYKKVKREQEDWPTWKKKAYNELFATSEHSEKLQIDY